MATPSEVINPITISNYIRSNWDNFSIVDQTMKLIRAKGNIRTGQHGNDVVWTARGGRYSPRTVADFSDISDLLTAKKMDVQATLPWGEMAEGDGISRATWLKNNGQEALRKLTNEIIPHMAEGMTSAEYEDQENAGGIVARLLRADGEAYTGDGAPLYGLPSIFDISTTGNSPDVSARNEAGSSTIAVTDKFGSVYGRTYAGLSTAPSGLSTQMNKAQSRTWAPLLINTGSTGFGTSGSAGTGWSNNCLKILSEAITKQQWDLHTPDCAILAANMFAAFRNKLTDKQTIYVERATGADEELGLGGSAQYALHDGVKVYQSTHLQDHNGYLLSMKDVYLDVLQANSDMGAAASGFPGSKNLKGMDDMFDVIIENDPHRRGTTISVTFRGQFRINPKYQARLFDYKYS